MPPSPICCSSLYGPITRAGGIRPDDGGRLIPTLGQGFRGHRCRGRLVQEAVWRVVDRQQCLDPAEQGFVTRRPPPGGTAARATASPI